MSEGVLIAIITLAGSGIGSLCGIIVSSRLTTYRLEQLEKKVDKHNTVIERTYAVEQKLAVQDEQIKVANNRIEDLEKEKESKMNYNEILMTIITSVVIPSIIILGKAVCREIEENIKDKQVQKYLLIATGCIADAVVDTAQTFVDKLPDEDWNTETKQEAFALAKEKALQHLGLTGKLLLEEILGDFDGWINTKIEAEVKRLAVK